MTRFVLRPELVISCGVVYDLAEEVMILYCEKHGCRRVPQGTVTCPDCDEEDGERALG